MKPVDSHIRFASFCLTLTFVSALLLFDSCFDCREHVPQQFRFGIYQIELKAPAKIYIGDKISVSVSLPRYFYDSISRDYVDIDRKITVSLKLDKYTQFTVDSTDVFATPRTIFHDFDTYFDLKVFKGQLVNVYQHDCILQDGKWLLELEYTTKRAGVFYFDPVFMDINTSRSDLPKGVCSLGDPQFDAKILFNPANDQIPDDGYFGFVVE